MRIGVPRESKQGETRVGLLPDAVAQLVRRGHAVLVEAGAGLGVGVPDEHYRNAGAELTDETARVFGCDLIAKVKELQAAEWPLLRMGTVVAAFQQLATDATLLDAVIRSGISCIAYEALEDEDGQLPVLAPMSRIAGTLAVQLAGGALWRGWGDPSGVAGPGILLNAIDQLDKRHALVLGAGKAGCEAARSLVSRGVEVTVLSRSIARREELLRHCAAPVRYEIISPAALAAAIRGVDVVIGAVLDRGHLSPKLIQRQHLRSMTPGGVLVDVGIDHGGIALTSRPSTLAEPFYVEEGITHCCIANLPALVPQSANRLLSDAVLPSIMAIAEWGLAEAMTRHAGLLRGLQVHAGGVADARLAHDCGRPWQAF